MSAVVDDTPVVRRTLLTSRACADVVGRIDALRPRWRERGRDFYSLGASVYLDVGPQRNLDGYAHRAAADNELLAGEFPDLLESCRLALEDELNAPCTLASGATALPGFHLFLARSLTGAARDRLHLDLQFRHLGPATRLDTPTRTFTLPVELPPAGGGIEFSRGGSGRPYIEREDYRLGELFVHTGRTLHRRACYPGGNAGRRITLQGHALAIEENRWLLYW
ncbi:hypothetical protein GCM10010172_66750 [Paractinoplanes ferrugineus]|uniref:Uncharacterized protein n=1 Tax=Paractinoplanes ferrugineus TaxID=113564 RepID=A0A919J5V9_9ACTN|nr:hypothetical protein [Actinoplanes ferrugineus]GIE13164.1 hypothetical protein Afe05nite_50040 [Actinoplanes ferrugineus]